MDRRAFIATAGAAALGSRRIARAQGTPGTCDLVLRGGILVDGTGAAARLADVGVTAGRVSAVGEPGGIPAGKQEIDCRGRVVCPGFIDMNTHLDLRCYSSMRAYTLPEQEGPLPEWCLHMMLEQGVTTVLAGNAGRSAADVEAHLAAVGGETPGVNYGTLVGHLTARAAGAEGTIERLLAGLRAGAFGVSSDLAALPEGMGELQALVRAAGSASEGALLSLRLRDTGAGLTTSVREALDLALEGGARLHISRLRATLDPGWAQLEPALDLIDQAAAAGMDVAADTYAHTGCGMSVREAYLPPELAAPETDEVLTRRRNEEALLTVVADRLAIVDPTAYYPRTRVWDAVYELTLVEVARFQRSLSLLDFVVDLCLREKALDPGLVAQGVYVAEMLLGGLFALLRRPWVAIASDAGGAPAGDTGQLFPWCFANTVRALSMCSEGLPASLLASSRGNAPSASPLGPAPIPPDRPTRTEPTEPAAPTTEPTGPSTPPTPPDEDEDEDEAPPEEPRPFGFEEAVRRMTSLPAARLGLSERGTLSVGACADLVVLDPARLVDRAAPPTPTTRPSGIVHVLVNGVQCVEAGKWNGQRAGAVLRRG